MTDNDPSTPTPSPSPGVVPPASGVDPRSDPTPPRPPRPTGPVQYKGDDLDAERGPGLGCFRFQVVVLVALIVLTPLSVVWDWPSAVSAILLFVVILLLLVTGQTIIFLLRIVAADRRGRRRPLASESKTVGELEDDVDAEAGGGHGGADASPVAEASRGADASQGTEPPAPGPVEDPDGVGGRSAGDEPESPNAPPSGSAGSTSA